MITLQCTTSGMAGFYGLWLGAAGEALASGTNGLLIRSIDDGTSWAQISLDRKRWSLGGVARLPSGELLVACGGGRIATSEDDGTNWVVKQLRHKDPMHQISATSSLVIVCGCNRVAWRTTGSDDWQESSLPRGVWTRGVCIDAKGDGFVTSSNGRLFRLDAGAAHLDLIASWRVQALHAPMFDGDTIVVAGAAGFTAHSRDAGATWTTPEPSTSKSLTGGTLMGSTLVVGTTDGGVLLSKDLGASWVTEAASGTGPARVHRLVANPAGLCLVVSEEGVFQARLPAV